MNTVIIVQARLGSTRLPGKILKDVAGKPLLEHLVLRLRRIRNADRVVIATTDNPRDLPIVALCKKIAVDYFQGSEQDVLLRYFDAATQYQADNIVRINSDCPLIDPAVAEKVIQYFLDRRKELDYASNILESSYPIGMHTEIFPFSVLQRTNLESVDPVERENVTPFIYRNPKIFRLASVVYGGQDLSHHRWTLDYPEDYELIKRIFDALYPLKPDFDMMDILELLKKHNDWPELNAHLKKKQTV
jgi:spore coat polysaccharide biosynthesis protein SpsF